jgi:hypothetical protein
MFEDIKESRAFRNNENMEKYSVNELSDIFFTMMMTLHLLDHSKFSKDIIQYTKDTLRFPLFERVYLSGTDLSNVISTIKNAKEILGEKNADIPVLEIKRYLRNFEYDSMSESLKRQLFLKIQNKLKIHNSSLISLRREIVDANNLSWFQKKKIGDRLYQLLRRQNYRCDILVLLQKFMDSKEG